MTSISDTLDQKIKDRTLERDAARERCVKLERELHNLRELYRKAILERDTLIASIEGTLRGIDVTPRHIPR